MRTDFIVTAGERAKRLDVFLAAHKRGLSRSRLQRLIRLGRVRVNELSAKPSQLVRGGDRISFDVPQGAPLEEQGRPCALEILFEDDALLVINKPAGVVMHPGPGHWTGTLLNALIHYLASSGEGLKGRPGLVHRLDKATSGVLVVAKTEESHRRLCVQFERHDVERVYEAVVRGVPRETNGMISRSIGRDGRNRTRVSTDAQEAKSAMTAFELFERYGDAAALLHLQPRTGRTHQLRVHLTAMGHPILGDIVYGGSPVAMIGSRGIHRVMLHAKTLGFVHPCTGASLTFMAPSPRDLQDLREALKLDNDVAQRPFQTAGRSIRPRNTLN